PVVTSLARHESAVRGRPGQNVVLRGLRCSRPIAWNTLTMLVQKYIGISFARIQFRHVLRDYDAFGVDPGTIADPAAGVGRLVTVVGVSFHAKVGVPSFVAETHGAGQLLANTICAAQSAQISRLALGAADEKTHVGISLAALGAKALMTTIAENNQHR